MLIYKITLSISGDNFYPQQQELPASDALHVEDIFNPNDLIKPGSDKQYSYGSIMYMHNAIFARRKSIINYEEEFIRFLEKHNSWYKDSGVTEYQIFTEVYYSGSQCNFEILGKDSLERLRKLDINFTFPVSIYKLKKKEIKELLA